MPAALVLGYEAWCSTPWCRLVLGHLLELLVLEVVVLESTTANASHHSWCTQVPTFALYLGPTEVYTIDIELF